MDPLGVAFLIWLFSRGSSSSSSSSSSPALPKPAPGGAHVYPPAMPADTVPVSVPSGATGSKKWIVYHPLTPTVIARAEALLKDPTAKAETIERDQDGNVVRYLKLNAPPGHTSVTAWRPNPNYKPPAGAPVYT